MSHVDDVIPIASRRHASPVVAGPDRVAPSRRNRRWIALFIASVLAAGGLFVLAQDRVGQIARLSPAHRAVIFARAREDMFETCTLPEADTGPLREHCLNQAVFVVQFPECNGACQQAARALLPRATR